MSSSASHSTSANPNPFLLIDTLRIGRDSRISFPENDVYCSGMNNDMVTAMFYNKNYFDGTRLWAPVLVEFPHALPLISACPEIGTIFSIQETRDFKAKYLKEIKMSADVGSQEEPQRRVNHCQKLFEALEKVIPQSFSSHRPPTFDVMVPVRLDRSAMRESQPFLRLEGVKELGEGDDPKQYRHALLSYNQHYAKGSVYLGGYTVMSFPMNSSVPEKGTVLTMDETESGSRDTTQQRRQRNGNREMSLGGRRIRSDSTDETIETKP